MRTGLLKRGTKISAPGGLEDCPPLPIHRFTVSKYHRMIESGVLGENDPVELLEGWIVPKMPHNPAHDTTMSFVNNALDVVLPVDWMLRIQCAVTTADSEPEPDVAVVRGPAQRYLRAHPRPRDIGLVVKVAESSLLIDRNVKAHLYARARLPVYWIVNLLESKVEVYTQPKGGRSPAYLQRRDYGKQESIPVILDGRKVGQVAARDLLP